MDLSDLVDAVRRHMRIVVAGVVVAALVAALYVFTRHETRPPDKFRAVANVQIPARAPTNRNQAQPDAVAPANMPEKLLRGQVSMALSPDVRKKALSDSGIPTNDTSVSFSAQLNSTGDIITLMVTSTDANATNKLIGNYVNAFADARTAVSAQTIQESQQGSQQQLNALQARRNALESQLRARINPLPPIVTDPSLTTDTSGSGNSRANQQQQAVPIIPPGTDSDTALLLYERNALANRIIAVQLAIADAAVNSNVPSSYTQVLDQSGASIIPTRSSSPLMPVGVILLAGLALGLGGAVLVDRRDHTIRSVRMASSTLSTPLLSTVPPPGRGKPEYAVFERPDSDRSAAFRKLAATSLATDRLPTAIMVSTPEGEAYDYVAANFAAALAELGVRVALVGTTPSQSWYLEHFTVPAEGGNDLPQLLERAHAGRFNGEATRSLAWSELSPNLALVPPAPETPLTVPLDGLPPLLDALDRAGIDVTVIAGPPLLQDANATIFAWSTRSVLWVVQAGVVHRRAASEAAARLELASVEPFGLVMVGAPED